jgi:glycopeptide antibiotics resistance protein
MRIIGAVLAVVFIAVILYITVFSRNERHLGVDLIPFSSFERVKSQPEMYRSMLMNVLLFVPPGLSLPFVFGGSTVKRILLTILTGFLLSVIVEAIQYFGVLGMAETDDVLCNTLGTVIGSCAYPLSQLWRKLFREYREKKASDQ